MNTPLNANFIYWGMQWYIYFSYFWTITQIVGTHNMCLEQKYKKNIKICDEIFSYTAKKNDLISDCMLHGQVFSSPEPLGSQGELIGWP